VPSNETTNDETRTRRRVLASTGATAAVGLAGCSGRIPGTGPTEYGTETSVTDGRVLWRYPPREDDRDGIGYAAVEAERRERRGDLPPVLRLRFNSTVGRLAASDPYRGYEPDWFRFRVWPPGDYDGRLDYHFRAEPPGQWDGFSTRYDVRGAVKQAVVRLDDVNTQGTIVVPAVFDPGLNPLPGELRCSFTVQASRPGLLGRTVRVTDSATLDV